MGLLDSITVAIAGPIAVKQSQERGLERKYSHVAESLKSVTDSLPEPPLQELPVRNLLPPHPVSLRSYRTKPGSLLSARPKLQRSQSEVPTIIEPPGKQQFPPDITTLELTPEQVRRTYSHNNVWDVKDLYMPPLPEMVGFGKYRSSVNADKQWHIEKVKRSMSDLDSLVKDLDNLSPGLSNEEWEQCKKEQLTRRSSVVTSQSTESNSSYGVEFIIDGTRISRGFSPSTVSSANSSFRDGRANFRKDSNLSITSMNSENRRSFGSRTPYALSTQGIENNLPRIASLRRMKSAMRSSQKKIEQPCEFGTRGGPESAVASDVSDIDDDEEEDSEWTDVVELPRCQNSSLSKILGSIHPNEPQENGTRVWITLNDLQQRRTSRNGIDRSETVRAVSRKRPRRCRSRNGGLPPQKVVNKGSNPEISNRSGISPEVTGEIEDLSVTEMLVFPQKMNSGMGDSTLSTSFQNETINESPMITKTSRKFVLADNAHVRHVTLKETPSRRRRNRSGTAVRINPSGLPVLKPALDDRD